MTQELKKEKFAFCFDHPVQENRQRRQRIYLHKRRKTADMNEKKLTLYRRKHLGYIFQMYNLIPNLNIEENVEVGAYLSDNPLDVGDTLTFGDDEFTVSGLVALYDYSALFSSPADMMFDAVKFRIIRIKIADDKYETLVTNLWNKEFSAKEIKNIYKLRWDIETSFRELKYHVELIAFHSKKTV